MTKVISLSDDAYDILKKLKSEGESFSEVVRRIAKPDIRKYAGVLKENSAEWGKISKEIYEDRKRTKLREYRL